MSKLWPFSVFFCSNVCFSIHDHSILMRNIHPSLSRSEMSCAGLVMYQPYSSATPLSAYLAPSSTPAPIPPPAQAGENILPKNRKKNRRNKIEEKWSWSSSIFFQTSILRVITIRYHCKIFINAPREPRPPPPRLPPPQQLSIPLTTASRLSLSRENWQRR